MNTFARRVALVALLSSAIFAAQADNTPQTLPFNQDWSTTTLITANDNWSAVPGVEGYLGQDITAATGTDPQTLTGVSAVANDLDVIANQTNPNTTTAGGAAEFDTLANPSVALQGSGTADAPYLLINLNTTGQTGITVAYNLRDLDGSADNAVMPVALQYRVGNSGAFTNVPGGFVADATTGPSLATLVTAVSAALPAAADNQALVQVRIITANAVGNDEWVRHRRHRDHRRRRRDARPRHQRHQCGRRRQRHHRFHCSPSASTSPRAPAASASTTPPRTTPPRPVQRLRRQGTAPRTILEGATSVTISVDVNGDTAPEAQRNLLRQPQQRQRRADLPTRRASAPSTTMTSPSPRSTTSRAAARPRRWSGRP